MAKRFRGQAQSLTAAAPPPGPTFVPPDGDEVLDFEKIRLDLERRVQNAYMDMASLVNHKFKAEGINFDIRAALPEETRAIIGQTVMKGAEQWLRDAYREVIVEATQEGWSVPQTANEIVALVDGQSTWRAMAMARTDLVGTANSTSYLSALKEFAPAPGYGDARADVRKQWLATDDERTRETHIEAHGQQRPMREPFNVGGSALRYPGDFFGPPDEVINCRCTLIYTTVRVGGPLDERRPSDVLLSKAEAQWTNEDIWKQNYEDLKGIDPDIPMGDYRRPHYADQERIDSAIAKWRDKIVAKMEAEFTGDQMRVAIRADEGVVGEILDSGRFESQFESGRSRGLLDYEVRKTAELDMFHYPKDLDPMERPIYGYLSGGPTDEGGTVTSYGNVTFELKPEVKARTTFASTDSLNSNVAPSPVLKPRLTSLYRSRFETKIGLDQPLENWDTVYWEAQIHGGVKLDDVRRIVIYYQAPDRWVTAEVAQRYKQTAEELAERIRGMLRARGINLTVELRPDSTAEQLRLAGMSEEAIKDEIAAKLGLPAGSLGVGRPAGSLSGLTENLALVDRPRHVLPVAPSEDGLDGKLSMQNAESAIEDTAETLPVSGAALRGDEEAVLASDRDDLHALIMATPSGAGSTLPDMPWHVEANHAECDGKYAVVKDDDGSVAGCHDTRADANRQLAALYAKEEKMSSENAAVTASTVTVTITEGEPEAIEAAERVKPWEGVLALAGSPTSDRRYLIPGEISHRDLPIPFRVVLTQQEGGHAGAVNVGSIDSIEFIPLDKFDKGIDLGEKPEHTVVIWGSGMLDGSEGALEAERVIGNGARISIDMPWDRLAAIDPDTFEEVPEDELQMEDIFAGKYLTGMAGRIAAATVVDVSAFEETTVRLTEVDAVVASAWAGDTALVRVIDPMVEQAIEYLTASISAPLEPPRDWFFMEEPDEPTPMTITSDGRIYGHVALWNTCHAGRANGAFSSCMYAPHSPSGYKQFHLGAMLCDDGAEVAIGRVTVGTGHAPLHLGAAAARRHYDNTGACAAYVRAADGVFGIWVSGVIRSDAPDEMVRDLRACPPSGDWRSVDHALELQAILAVNVPGYVVPRSQLALAASAENLEVATLILGGPHSEDYAEALRAEVEGNAEEAVELLFDLDQFAEELGEIRTPAGT